MNKLLAISIVSASIAIGAIPAVAEVDPKVAEMCMKAVDFQGCVNAMTGKKNSSENEKKILLTELKKLPSRLKNTSLRDFHLSTRDFTDALALSTPENVGVSFYQKAKQLSEAIDVLQNVWSRKIKYDSDPQCASSMNTCWNPSKNLEAKLILDASLEGNTLDIRCRQWGWISRAYVGEDIFFKVRDIVSEASMQLASRGDFSFPSQEEPPFYGSTYSQSCIERE